MRTNTGAQDFLSWGAGSTDIDRAAATTVNQVTAVDEKGCGYEAQLESWYRFLVDPAPVAGMTNDQQTSVRGATNAVVLDQRAHFLRGDSAVMIVMLSDENDCSILDENGSQGWLVGFNGTADNWRMPRATSACAKPDDPCCRPCGSQAPAGCASDAEDPACSQPTLTRNEDGRLELDDASKAHLPGIDQQLQNAGIDPTGECICEIAQLDGDAGTSCLNDGAPASDIHGFCYLDPADGVGDASLVSFCPAGEQQRIRFVGSDTPASNAVTFLVLPLDPSN